MEVEIRTQRMQILTSFITSQFFTKALGLQLGLAGLRLALGLQLWL